MKITWLLSTLLLCPALAQALDLCVANDSQFSNALLAANLTPGSSKIKLVRNVTFHVPPQFDPTSDQSNIKMHDLTIEGGYATGCSDASYQLAPTATSISGTGSGGFQISGLGTLRLSNLSFSSFTHPIKIYGITNTALNARVTHARFVNGRGVYFDISADDSSIIIDNSLFAQQSPPDSSAAALYIYQEMIGSGLDVRLTNNTITANSFAGVFVGGSTADVSLFNNILFGNGESSDYKDLENVHPVLAVANVIGTHHGTYGPGSNANLTSDPQFVSSSNYNIKLTSPAYDSGLSSPPGGLSAYDIDGEDRVVGGSVDRGAYENNNSGATILLVTNTNDSGPGSLRTAITDANANPVDNIIGFNISGACPRTIAVNTELPAIVGNLSIRGYTQPGAKLNTSGFTDNATICVELVEATGHTVSNGLRFAPAPSSTSQDVSGLAIGNFTTGVRVDGPISGNAVGCSIWGNFIGLAANGTTLRANPLFGINIESRSRCTVGGDDNAKRNVIAGALVGVRLANTDSSFIVNNYIGTTSSGNTARPNSLGVLLLSAAMTVEDNLISGNSVGAITVSEGAFYNQVHGNRIGLAAFRICIPPCAPDFNALGNGGDAISITSGARNDVYDNSIAFNQGAGVRVSGTGSNGNRISGNSIYANDGLGIDLGVLGVDPVDNDVTTPPGTPNHGLNAPLMNWARGGLRSGTVFGELRTINDNYKVEIFASDDCDASGHGEGRTLIGTVDVTVDNATATENGSKFFYAPVVWTNDLAGKAITATVQGRSFDFSTSEFSACKPYEFIDKIFADGFDPLPP
ncbi:MAG: hypothetical protein IPP82_10570 [Xanthomonadales bacterium]|nr:hypothetical protein [Xanthomonadales bacterium]